MLELNYMAAEQDPVSEALSDTVDDVTRGCFGSFLIFALITTLSVTCLFLMIKDLLS